MTVRTQSANNVGGPSTGQRGWWNTPSVWHQAPTDVARIATSPASEPAAGVE